MYRAVCVFIAAICLVSASATQAEPLQPAGAWIPDNEKTQCVISRQYGSAADPITLALRESPSGDTYEILVGWKYRVSEPVTEEDSTIDFGRGPIHALALFYQTATKTIDVHSFRISAADMVQARSAKRLTVHIAGSADLVFDLTSMPQALDDLQSCIANLKQFWNSGGEKDGRIAQPAKANLVSIFSNEDYPRLAERRRQQGTGQYLLLVDEKGKVAGCQVLRATGAPLLDTMACQIIETRAKFAPARDPSGKPVRSTFVTPPISWMLEG